MKKISGDIIGVIMVIGLLVTLFFSRYSNAFETTVEAQSPKRLLLQTQEYIGSWGAMQVICDQATGILIYRAGNSMPSQPNGCAKNLPR